MTEPLLIEGGILLNFSAHGFWAPHPFRLELCWYPTVEHYFQAGKAAFLAPFDRRLAGRLYDEIVAAFSARLAKQAGRQVQIDVLVWDEYAPRRMLEGLLYKFTQNGDAAVALCRTDGYPLVEHRRDPVWGDNLDGTGRNLMGLALMHVRDKLCTSM